MSDSFHYIQNRSLFNSKISGMPPVSSRGQVLEHEEGILSGRIEMRFQFNGVIAAFLEKTDGGEVLSGGMQKEPCHMMFRRTSFRLPEKPLPDSGPVFFGQDGDSEQFRVAPGDRIRGTMAEHGKTHGVPAPVSDKGDRLTRMKPLRNRFPVRAVDTEDPAAQTADEIGIGRQGLAYPDASPLSPHPSGRWPLFCLCRP